MNFFTVLIIYSFKNKYFCTPSQPSLYKGRMAANSSEENSSSLGGNTNRGNGCHWEGDQYDHGGGEGGGGVQ